MVKKSTVQKHRGKDTGMCAKEGCINTGDPSGRRPQEGHKPTSREDQVGSRRESERTIVPMKPGNSGGGKGSRFKGSEQSSESDQIGTGEQNLGTEKTRTQIPSVRELQRTLYPKAKKEPHYRFYSLYDKIYRSDVLQEAWQRCRANKGVAGVDGESFGMIEKKGLENWIEGLQESLRNKTYKPQALKRVNITKRNGKLRPLGIPTIRDRVAQMATTIILEAVFEADLREEQYGYRPNRNAHDALRKIHGLLKEGHREIVDADLSEYFESIPHRELMKSLARRISDGSMLALLKQWLEMAVEESDGHGRKKRTTRNKDQGRGTPQGSPISPLLANIYMRRFVMAWKKLGLEERLGKIVNYADDLVILCRNSAQQAREEMGKVMKKLKLTVNEEKTQTRSLPKENFNFLGYTLGKIYSPRTGRAYIGVKPDKIRVEEFCKVISEKIAKYPTSEPLDKLVKILNMRLNGWAGYFSLGTVTRARKAVADHTRKRLYTWLCKKCPDTSRRTLGDAIFRGKEAKLTIHLVETYTL